MKRSLRDIILSYLGIEMQGKTWPRILVRHLCFEFELFWILFIVFSPTFNHLYSNTYAFAFIHSFYSSSYYFSNVAFAFTSTQTCSLLFLTSKAFCLIKNAVISFEAIVNICWKRLRWGWRNPHVNRIYPSVSFFVDKRVACTRNEGISWYQYSIPVREGTRRTAFHYCIPTGLTRDISCDIFLKRCCTFCFVPHLVGTLAEYFM